MKSFRFFLIVQSLVQTIPVVTISLRSRSISRSRTCDADTADASSDIIARFLAKSTWVAPACSDDSTSNALLRISWLQCYQSKRTAVWLEMSHQSSCFCLVDPRSKAKGPDIYILPLTRKPEQQQFTMRSGVLTNISSRQRNAISAPHCPNKQTLDPQCAAR